MQLALSNIFNLMFAALMSLLSASARAAASFVNATSAIVMSALAELHDTLAWLRARIQYLIAALVLSLANAMAMAQSATIDIDTDTFINAINQWLPLALTITAIGVGIAGGFKLAMFIGRMLINAFDGRI